MGSISRRHLLKVSGTAALGLGAFPIAAKEDGVREKQLKIVVVGAHPDDPEQLAGEPCHYLLPKGMTW